MMNREGHIGVSGVDALFEKKHNAAEEGIYVAMQTALANNDLGSINLAQSEEYVTNSRGQQLHVRTSWPAYSKLRGLVIFLHGFGSHANRPLQRHLSQSFNSMGLAYAMFDFHGHGYSEGERALVYSPDDLVDDVLCLLKAIYADEKNEKRRVAHKYFLNNHAPSDIPFFLLGHSMGGGVAIITGLRLKAIANLEASFESLAKAGNKKHFPPPEPINKMTPPPSPGKRNSYSPKGGRKSLRPGSPTPQSTKKASNQFPLLPKELIPPPPPSGEPLKPMEKVELATSSNDPLDYDSSAEPKFAHNFKGCLLIAPCINLFNHSLGLVQLVVEWILAPLLRGVEIPRFLGKSNDSDTDLYTWDKKVYREYVNRDRFPQNKDGLSWGGEIKFASASSILRLGDFIKAHFSHINFPFWVCHDPDEQFIAFSGTESLMEFSSTPAKHKMLLPFPGALHDPLMNKLSIVTDKMTDWLQNYI